MIKKRIATLTALLIAGVSFEPAAQARMAAAARAAAAPGAAAAAGVVPVISGLVPSLGGSLSAPPVSFSPSLTPSLAAPMPAAAAAIVAAASPVPALPRALAGVPPSAAAASERRSSRDESGQTEAGRALFDGGRGPEEPLAAYRSLHKTVNVLEHLWELSRRNFDADPIVAYETQNSARKIVSRLSFLKTTERESILASVDPVTRAVVEVRVQLWRLMSEHPDIAIQAEKNPLRRMQMRLSRRLGVLGGGSKAAPELAAPSDESGEKSALLKTMESDAQTHLIGVTVGGSSAIGLARSSAGGSLRRMRDRAAARAERYEKLSGKARVVAAGAGAAAMGTVAGPLVVMGLFALAGASFPPDAAVALAEDLLKIALIPAVAVVLPAAAAASWALAKAAAPRALASYLDALMTRRMLERQRTVSPRGYLAARLAAFLKSNRDAILAVPGVTSVAMRRGSRRSGPALEIKIEQEAAMDANEANLLSAVPELAGYPVTFAVDLDGSAPRPWLEFLLPAAVVLIGLAVLLIFG